MTSSIPSQEERLQRWQDSWGRKCYHRWEAILGNAKEVAPYCFEIPRIGRRCTKCEIEELF